MGMRLIELMGRHGLSVGLETAGTRPNTMISWLDWDQAARLTDMVAAERIETEQVHRLSVILTLDDETVTVIVEPDETEYRNTGAQVLLDYDAGIGEQWQTSRGVVTLAGVRALSQMRLSDEALDEQMAAIIETATSRMQRGRFAAPLPPVTPEAEILATLLGDALPGWGVDWADFILELHRNPGLIETARLLNKEPRGLRVHGRRHEPRQP